MLSMRLSRLSSSAALTTAAATALTRRRSYCEAAKPDTEEVVVLGGGVIGVTTAYSLARAGYKVTVIDQHHAVGLGTSQVNACSLRVSSFGAINNPGAAAHFAKALLMGDPVFHFAWGKVLTDPDFWRWGLQYVRACASPEWHAKSAAYLRDVSKWSQALTVETAAREGVHFDLRSDCGAMVTFVDDQQSFDAAAAGAPSKEAAGVRTKVLDAAAALELEPALGAALDGRVCGALHFEQDMHGDCRAFTEGLARVCAARYGVRFRHDAAVIALETAPAPAGGARGGGGAARVVAVHTSGGRVRVPERAAVIVCLGAQSDVLTRGVGVRLPIYPMKGYSITVDVGELAAAAPHLVPRGMTILEPLHTYVLRMDARRVRFASIAEFAGWDERAFTPACVDALRARAAAFYPQLRDALHADTALVRTGGRPQTPDDVPIVSATRVPNLYVNSGHGQYGWRLACSSAEILASLVAGAPPPEQAPDVSHLSLERFEIKWWR